MWTQHGKIARCVAAIYGAVEGFKLKTYFLFYVNPIPSGTTER